MPSGQTQYETLEVGGVQTLVNSMKGYADRNSGVDTAQLKDGSVTGAKIKDGEITADKFSSTVFSVVTSAQIQQMFSST